MRTLAQLDAGRNNNFDLLRFFAAGLVIFAHSYLVFGQIKNEPISKLSGYFDAGGLGVKIFFAISGYLITKSVYRQPTLRSFVWARCLRIFPGLFFAALFCGLIIGPICTTLPLTAYFKSGLLYDFMWRLTTLHNFGNLLPGTFNTNSYPGIVNSPIWTLPAELLFYTGVFFWGLLLLIWRKYFKQLLLALPLMAAIGIFYFGIHFPYWYLYYVISWGALFVLGGICFLARDFLPVNTPLVIFLFLLAFLSHRFQPAIFMAAFNVAIVYAVLVFAYHPGLIIRNFSKPGDFSYGLYIYAFPIQQLLVFMFPNISLPVHFFAAFLLALTMAALSWHLVEKPMLKLKNWRLNYKS